MEKKYYKNGKKFHSNRIQKIAFVLALFLSIGFYFINLNKDNSLLDFISKNLLLQTVVFFLTIVTILSLFIRMTFRKELNEDQVKKISSNEFKENLENESENRRIKEEASF